MSQQFISISGQEELKKLSQSLYAMPAEIEKSAVSAINDALKSAGAEGVRMARETYTAEASQIRQSIRRALAKRGQQVGQVDFVGKKGTPLAFFTVSPRTTNFKGVPVAKRQPKLGLWVKIKKKGASKLRRGPDGEKSFFAKPKKSPRTHIFFREKGNKGRGKIQMMFGPSYINALQGKENNERLQNYALNQFRKRLDYYIERNLLKVLGKL